MAKQGVMNHVLYFLLVCFSFCYDRQICKYFRLILLHLKNLKYVLIRTIALYHKSLIILPFWLYTDMLFPKAVIINSITTTAAATTSTTTTTMPTTSTTSPPTTPTTTINIMTAITPTTTTTTNIAMTTTTTTIYHDIPLSGMLNESSHLIGRNWSCNFSHNRLPVNSFLKDARCPG